MYWIYDINFLGGSAKNQIRPDTYYAKNGLVLSALKSPVLYAWFELGRKSLVCGTDIGTFLWYFVRWRVSTQIRIRA